MSTLKVDGIRSNSASSDAITLASDGTCTANITNKPNRNLIINGAFTINQRKITGHGSSGIRVVDRWSMSAGGLNNSMHQYQVDITAGDLPYTKGFRKMYRLTNDGQNADSNDYIQAVQHIEAQNIATSGWNYVSSSSFITLSFYVRASVPQTYHGYLQTHDGTSKTNSFSFALAQNTWTKVTKTFPGDSGITINNDIGAGLTVHFTPFMGTDYTSSGVTDGAWQTYASGDRTKDQTSTWMTTAYSTFELTGVQLEVGSVATDFEHRSYAQELALCQRYYYMLCTGDDKSIGTGSIYTDNYVFNDISFPVTMRTNPSLDQITGGNYYAHYSSGTADAFDQFIGINNSSINGCKISSNNAGGVVNMSAGKAVHTITSNSASYLAFSAEL